MVFVGICITLLTVPPFPAPNGLRVFRSSARKSSLNSTPSSNVAICSLISAMDSGFIVSSTECAFRAAFERTRDALDPGTWASAALEAGFKASLGEGRLRFLILRAFALLVEGPMVVVVVVEDAEERGGGDMVQN